ncbi:MAG: NADH-quinone oxidoreductase subunit C [Planctomycetota bacterium]|nr:NADH-quinone oxidoreductase subunit C [Planctomycetota bacterium]
MTEELKKTITDKFEKAEFYENAIGLVCVVAPEKFREAALFCRNEPSLAFDFLNNYTAADFPPERFEVFAQMYSYENRIKLTLKTMLDRSEPRVPSLVEVWSAANWYEREMYDLFGIIFAGHPDLRRLFLPEYWIGHPLRKDYSDDRLVPKPEVLSE